MTECNVLKTILKLNDINLINEWVYHNCTCETCSHKSREILIAQDIYKKNLETKYKSLVNQENVIMKVKINETMKNKIINYQMKNSILDILIESKYSKLKSNYWIQHAINFVNNKYSLQNKYM